MNTTTDAPQRPHANNTHPLHTHHPSSHPHIRSPWHPIPPNPPSASFALTLAHSSPAPLSLALVFSCSQSPIHSCQAPVPRFRSARSVTWPCSVASPEGYAQYVTCAQLKTVPKSDRTVRKVIGAISQAQTEAVDTVMEEQICCERQRRILAGAPTSPSSSCTSAPPPPSSSAHDEALSENDAEDDYVMKDRLTPVALRWSEELAKETQVWTVTQR